MEGIFEVKRERNCLDIKMEDREGKFGAGEGICQSKLLQQSTGGSNVRKLVDC